ncbi:hypothetical protein BGW39_000792 [Mortierella sp. 14UC]|nr:hypothetical protein BGW39_000792 [Mortierella sp. 14UC]
MKVLRGTLSALFASLLATIESNPLALMVLQYLAAASRAAIIYLVSVIWTLAQSLFWMVTAEGLDWIQSQSFGPLILEWDSFLFGAVFLTVEIHPDSIEYHHAKRCCGWSSSSSVKSHSRTNSRSSSLSTNNTGRRVTFDEQVMVLGGSGAAGARGGVTPILVNSSNSYYSSSSSSYSGFSQVPHAPIMTESPTRSTFAPAPSFSSLQEAEYLQRNYGYGYQFIDSPSSSRSNSCRSSICSVSSSSSSESNACNDRESAKPTSPSTSSTKSNSSSRLAALFHSSSRHTTSHSPPCSSSSSSIDLSTQPSGTDKRSKNLVHRMLHPHQHKRELEHQHQLQLQLQQLQQQQQQQPQQQQMRHYPQPYHIPEFLDAMTTSSSVMDHEYQPSEHTRKTLKQRLGLKKKSLST